MAPDLHAVAVKDAFPIRPGLVGSDHDPGLVIIIDGRQCGFDLPSVGDVVDFVRPDGVGGRAEVAEMKEHGDGRSFFFRGLGKDDIPIGSVVYWTSSDHTVPPRDVVDRRESTLS
jgi:hypothetical protein